jgi:hypothetical protein
MSLLTYPYNALTCGNRPRALVTTGYERSIEAPEIDPREAPGEALRGAQSYTCVRADGGTGLGPVVLLDRPLDDRALAHVSGSWPSAPASYALKGPGNFSKGLKGTVSTTLGSRCMAQGACPNGQRVRFAGQSSIAREVDGFANTEASRQGSSPLEMTRAKFRGDKAI